MLGSIKATALAVLLFATSIASSAGHAALQGVPSSAPPVFQPFYRGPITSDDELRRVRDALPCESIGLELSGGMLVPGGRFRVLFHRDGRATLWNEAGSRFGDAGDHAGTVNVFDFARICHLMFDAGLDKLPSRYAARLSDLQTTTVSVTSDGRTVAVEDYGGAAPVQVWAIQKAIEAASFRIRWQRK